MQTDIFEKIIDQAVPLRQRYIRPGLEIVQSVLSQLGNPENALPPVIHFAGTNGKGSTLAALRALLKTMGLRVHAFTSPHLISGQERFLLGIEGGGARYVSEQELQQAISIVHDVSDSINLTRFEFLTIVGFVLFAAHPADYLLLETGMGGRLDATNILSYVQLSIITSIGLDHQHFLGNDIASIAGEKAGIIKPACPVIIASPQHEAQKVLCQRAQQVAAPHMVLGQDWDVSHKGSKVSLQDQAGKIVVTLPKGCKRSLLGQYQDINIGTAALAARLLRGQKFNDTILQQGIKRIYWPARMQKLSSTELPELHWPNHVDLWLDGGHNLQGIEAVVKAMQEITAIDPMPLYVILSHKQDRQTEPLLRILKSLNPVKYLIINNHGADDQIAPYKLANTIHDFGLDVEIIADWIYLTEQASRQKRVRYLICGSLYFCGAFLRTGRYQMLAR